MARVDPFAAADEERARERAARDRAERVRSELERTSSAPPRRRAAGWLWAVPAPLPLGAALGAIFALTGILVRGCADGDAANACAAGDLDACNGGSGEPPARRDAMRRIACAAGRATACSELGAHDEAMLARACLLGDLRACDRYGTDLAYPTRADRRADGARALVVWEQACELGGQESCARVAEAYADGTEVARDVARARRMQADACARGRAPSCAELGRSDRAVEP
jgi:hypothetical protein